MNRIVEHRFSFGFVILLFTWLAAVNVLAAPVVESPVDLVHPLIGSDRCRNFFMTAAARPFGMVKLAPDTEIFGYYHTGYQNAQTNIFGFSHIHEFQMGSVVVMPVSGTVNPIPGPERWKSGFNPAAQTVTPGYQKLHLDRYGITAELTATRRVGFHRYTFERADEAAVLMPLTGVWNEARMFSCDVKRTAPDTLEGSLIFADARLSTDSRLVVPTQVFFVLTTDRAFKSLDGWRTQEMVRNISGIKGENSGLVLNFGKVSAGTMVQMKVAISYCSIEQARLNLNTELPAWDFDAAHNAAREEWNTALSRIEVTGSSERKIKFYNGLWHALLGRGDFSDVNGKYPLYHDGQFSEINHDVNGQYPIGSKNQSIEIKTVPLNEKGEPAFAMQASDAFWWTQQNLDTLWGLAYPDVLRDFCNSWLRFYDDAGELPMGATPGRLDYIMSGDQAAPLLGRAMQMNLPGVDGEHALAAMKALHKGTNRPMGDVDIYDKFGGWMPADLGEHKWSVTRTVENSFCDWILGEVAQKLGHTEDADRYLRRSLGWTNLYNPANGWLQPRNADGTWFDPFDPLLCGSQHFLESYSAVLTWFPVNDLDGMMQVMGGREKTIQRLEEQFERAAPQNFRFGWLQYENNTGFHHAHLFNLLGDPVKSQRWVREVYNANYSLTTTSPDAYAHDDEDQGQMGALSALMAMGLFQLRGGCELNPSYELTAPMLDRVVIHLQPDCYSAKDFIITAGPNPEKNCYIQSVTLNGQPLTKLVITQEQIRQGVRLNFVLSAKPNPAWTESAK
jgi:putative alpha-1,2-mannosidase